MKVLFTRSNLWGSRLIRAITGESVSHVAILWTEGNRDLVLHSSLHGVDILPAEEFIKSNRIIYVVDRPNTPVPSDIAQYTRLSYDYPAFFYLGFCLLLNIKPRRNNWALRKAHICTELVTEILTGTADSTITPEKLYLQLKGNYLER